MPLTYNIDILSLPLKKIDFNCQISGKIKMLFPSRKVFSKKLRHKNGLNWRTTLSKATDLFGDRFSLEVE